MGEWRGNKAYIPQFVAGANAPGLLDHGHVAGRQVGDLGQDAAFADQACRYMVG